MSDVTVYMTDWCPYCHALFESLAQQDISWDEVDVDEDAQAAARVESVNNGNRVVPTVEFSDGSTLTNPSATEVAEKLSALSR